MAPSQVARKHDFVAKVAEGCSSYDVIAPWPDLTRSIFLPKIAQGLPHKVAQNPAARIAPPFFAIHEKTSGGGGCTPPPPVRARVKFVPSTSVAEKFKPPRNKNIFMHFNPSNTVPEFSPLGMIIFEFVWLF